MVLEKGLSKKPIRFLVTNIQRYSVNDGPGIRTTVFLKGCPLKCAWCHNPESINPYQEFFFDEEKCLKCGSCAAVCPENAITPPIKNRVINEPKVIPIISSSGSIIDKINNGTFHSNTVFGDDKSGNKTDIEPVEIRPPEFNRNQCCHCLQCTEVCQTKALYPASEEMTIEQVYEEILKDKPFYDSSGGGVTISGGEPMIQPEITLELLKRAKADGIHTALDTTGLVKWNELEKMLPYIDLILYDLKILDDVKHQKWTGVSNKLILENLKRLAKTQTEIRLRFVVIHNVNYWDLEYAREIIEYAKTLGDAVIGIDIIPFHSFAEKKYKRLNRKNLFKGFPNLSEEDIEGYRDLMEEIGPWKPTIGGLSDTNKKNDLIKKNYCTN